MSGRRIVRFNLKYLVYDPDRRGNPRYYVRFPGRKKVRIREKPGTAAFLKAYQEAIDHEPKASDRIAKDTLAWLFQRYYESAEFKRLNKRTRHVRSLILDKLLAEHGHRRYRDLERKYVRKLRDDRFERPEAANGVVKALRQVYKWAMESDLVDKNPAATVPYLESNNPDGIHTWTVEEVEKYRKRHPIGTRPRLALELLMLTGVRRSDVVRLGLPMVRDGHLCFVEAKNANRAPKERAMPILPQLQEVIDASPFVGARTYLVTEFGRPFTVNGFGTWFRRRCNEAGLPQCSAHGLRKAGATIAAENGATDRQLMAIFGWETAKQVTAYTRKAEQRKLTSGAMHLLVAKE